MSSSTRTYVISSSLFLVSCIATTNLYLEKNAYSLIIAIVSVYLQFCIPHLQQYFYDLEEQKRDLERENELKKLREMSAQQRETGKLLIRRDLELTKANEKLRALDQMKTDFVTIATHQLRTPLTAIRWILSMFIRGDIGTLTDDQRTYVMKAYESNNRMVALLSDMLMAEKLNAEKIRIEPNSYTSFPDLADNVFAEIQPIAEKKGVNLQFIERRDKYPYAKIDPQNMRAILQNLLENAIKYTPSGKAVIFTIREQSDALVFEVADSGIGIPPEQQKNIFTRFFRAKNASQVETDGSGLGLYIVKGIVEKFHGHIAFQSVLGKGTTFRAVLPAAATMPTPPAPVSPAPSTEPPSAAPQA